ncbi:hypothetical protein EYR40_009871 [Pleurotus pulmonarius]|nr:hypothetical protein EYR38_002917 [Pleurotus pulmonarius]KAF4591268.1 hypothetical protein EYR40_009871 [Pleurotus pulmonarius]
MALNIVAMASTQLHHTVEQSTAKLDARDTPNTPNLLTFSAAGTPTAPSTRKLAVLEAPRVSLSLSDTLTPAHFASVFDICASIESTIASLENYASRVQVSRDTDTPKMSPVHTTSDPRPITLLLLGPRPTTPAIQLHACHADTKTMDAFRESRADDRSWIRGVPSCSVAADEIARREAATLCADPQLLHPRYRRQFQSESLPPVQEQEQDRGAARNVRGGVVSAAIRAASQRQAHLRPLPRHECVIRVEVERRPREGASVKKGVRATFKSLYRDSVLHERVRRVAGYASDVMAQGKITFGWGRGRGGPGIQSGRTPSNKAFSNAV